MASLLLAVGYFAGEAYSPGFGLPGLLLGLAVFCVQLAVYALAGEAVVMSGLGAREMTREESPRLFNIVEEMQLASGLGYIPKIYIVDNDSPNAFAIGHKPSKSAVAVTRGLMYRLNRDELQGVIAHEIAHLKNLDAKFMTLAGVMLGSIIILSDMAMRMFFYGGRGRRRSDSRSGEGGGQAQLIFLVVAILLVILGPLLARVLYFAISRSREYLADASAAVYTRYPEGLASALQNIARSSTPIGEVNRTVAPMFIVNPLQASGGSDSMFSTHPPLEDRIGILRSMGGASYSDYNKAFAGTKGKSIIGERTLRESSGQDIRSASAEGPLETRSETKTTVHRLYGYTTIDCTCGAKLNVPGTFMENNVRCIRCGQQNELPPLAERAMIQPIVPTVAPDKSAKLPVREYTRQEPGQWETIPCECGNQIELSPSFSAPTISCRKCGARIGIRS